MLVGLRWWSQIKEDGSEEWIFESNPDKQVNKVDAAIFWGGCYAMPLLWIIFLVTALLNFEINGVTMALLNIGLSGINLLGYIKCQKNHRSHVGSFLMQKAKESISKDQI